ncbi:MAG: DUF1631 domain-containing protein [Pseudomonadota bacterium]|nr:DUF1631 domain-containing protein [Pseudomonadota bacterium]
MSNKPLGGVSTTRTDPLRVLEEIKRLAVEQLGGLTGGLYRGIEQSLNNSVQSDVAGAGHFGDLSSLRMLRQQSATLSMRYRQQLAQGFDDFRGLRVRNRGELPLGLIDEAQLEFQIDAQRLAEAISHRYSRPLEMLSGRLQSLTAELGAPGAANPVGPERLAAAFVETFRDAQPTPSVGALMFRQYEADLGLALGDLYGRINTLLAAAGYSVHVARADGNRPRPATQAWSPDTVEPIAHGRLSELVGGTHPSGASRHGGGHGHGGTGQGVVHNAAARSQPSNANTHADNTPASAHADPSGFPDIAAELSDLRSLLHTWREGLAQSTGATSATTANNISPQCRELRVDEVLSVASIMQHEPPDAFARALAVSGKLADTIRGHLSDGARRIGLNPDQTRFSAQEEDAIDLVALLFESLFRSHSLQDRARRLYARLVLPYVKVALTDESVFVIQAHPARKLLDAITEACEGNLAATPQDRELLDRAAAASQRIVAEYNEDMAVFELAHAELDALLRQQRSRVELLEQRAVKATIGRERLSTARSTADSAVRERLGNARLTEGVAEFLTMPWRHHVVQMALRDGDDAARQADVLKLGDALVEADRLAAENRGHELAEHLLMLEPAIVQCLASSGLDDSAAQHGMAGLVQALSTPDRPRRVQPAPAQAAGDEDDGIEERRLWLVGGTASLGHDEKIATRMRQLMPGEWLRLTDAQGEVVPAKVAWISRLTSRLLLVNRRGLRVLVASAEELALLATAGRLVVGTERTAFDEAMRQVRQRLDKAVGQH